MLSAIAASSDRLCDPKGLDGRQSGEAIYRRRFARMVAAPVLLIALMLALAIVEHVRIGFIPPVEYIALSIICPFLVVLSLLWATVVWYGTYVCLSEAMISFHDMDMFFGVQTKAVSWCEIRDVALANDYPRKRSVVLILKEGAPLVIEGIPEPEHLYQHVEAKLSRWRRPV